LQQRFSRTYIVTEEESGNPDPLTVTDLFTSPLSGFMVTAAVAAFTTIDAVEKTPIKNMKAKSETIKIFLSPGFTFLNCMPRQCRIHAKCCGR
jgi:hypothetical protein